MKKTKSLLLSAPYLVWMVVFTLIPLGVVAYYALTDPATGAFSLGNIKNLGMYMPVLWKSIVYSLVSACICLVLGYPVAYFIAHCGHTTQKFLYMLVMLPMCMSFLLRTLAWVGLLQDTGIINSLLVRLGLPRLPLRRSGPCPLPLFPWRKSGQRRSLRPYFCHGRLHSIFYKEKRGIAPWNFCPI